MAPVTGVVVLITGTGRSGTSTMSGSLHHLGLHVPGPYLQANASNPKGFFESTWAVKFHKKITKAAGISDFDSRPPAFNLAQSAITPELRATLVAFLQKRSLESDQIVVKDPRSVWAQALWRDAAAEAGLEARFLTMLRHPAEVVGSRTTYYAVEREEPARRRHFQTLNIARWINHSLITERETRGLPRVFVRYPDLLADWRPVLAHVAQDLGLSYDSELTPGVHHAVDDFIDPGLRRHAPSWDAIDIPAQLQEVAQTLWDRLAELSVPTTVTSRTSDAAALDALQERYDRLYSSAESLSHDSIAWAKLRARAAGAIEAEEQIARRAEADAGRTVGQRKVADVSSRELLRIVGRRTSGRLRALRPR
ncbi:MAG TPA: sulfotransferase [Candidatus Limnocylindria bacterium]|nr:sulfotransferase [Candidatus Limnocylindria bacterium]